jgi:hypothetical protein
MYYRVLPPVCGEFGPQTERIVSVNPQVYTFVQFLFDRWPDDLVTSHPVFIANVKLTDALAVAGCTGFSTKPCKVDKSDYFDYEGRPEGSRLPSFIQMMVDGAPFCDDFGISDYDLIASARAKEILRRHKCDAVNFEPAEDLGLRG